MIDHMFLDALHIILLCKLDRGAKKTIFFNFSMGAKGFRLWCFESKKIMFNRDVTFGESYILKIQ